MIEPSEDEKLIERLKQALATATRRAEAAEGEAARLRDALRELLSHEVYTFEGNLEARITVPVDTINDARAALAGGEEGGEADGNA